MFVHPEEKLSRGAPPRRPPVTPPTRGRPSRGWGRPVRLVVNGTIGLLSVAAVLAVTGLLLDRYGPRPPAPATPAAPSASSVADSGPVPSLPPPLGRNAAELPLPAGSRDASHAAAAPLPPHSADSDPQLLARIADLEAQVRALSESRGQTSRTAKPAPPGAAPAATSAPLPAAQTSTTPSGPTSSQDAVAAAEAEAERARAAAAWERTEAFIRSLASRPDPPPVARAAKPTPTAPPVPPPAAPPLVAPLPSAPLPPAPAAKAPAEPAPAPAPAAQPSRPTQTASAPAAPQPPTRPRVFLLYRAGSQSGQQATTLIAQQLLFSNFAYADTLSARGVPATPSIRFFHSEDGAAAARLADLLRSTGQEYRVQDFTSSPGAAGHGTLEVWVHPPGDG